MQVKCMHGTRHKGQRSISASSEYSESTLRQSIEHMSKGLAKLANIACQTLLFVSVSSAMDNQRTLLSGREQ